MTTDYGLYSTVLFPALGTGVAAPDFDAFSFDGKKISLSALTKEGPIVLVFLRGFS